VVEIADTSFDLDTTITAAAYAASGLRAYRVMSDRTRTTYVHRDPRSPPMRSPRRSWCQNWRSGWRTCRGREGGGLQ
jgi:hypothetical protein